MYASGMRVIPIPSNCIASEPQILNPDLLFACHHTGSNQQALVMILIASEYPRRMGGVGRFK